MRLLVVDDEASVREALALVLDMSGFEVTTAVDGREAIRTLAIDPYYYPALLAKGMLLERGGETRKAALVYKDLLKIVPPDSEIPPELQEPLAHARDVVRENAMALERLLGSRLDEIRHHHANEKLDRFDECVDIVLGKKKVYTQEPSMLLYPHLPAVQFYDAAQFPWIAALEAASGDIREEFFALIDQDTPGFRPYVDHPAGSPLNQWRELNHSPRWSAYFLWDNGVRIDDHCRRCPRTTKAVEAAPLCDIPGFAPTVFFSILKPGTRIPPHTGVTNTRLVVHLPLVVPEACGFRVGNETRPWQPGRAWVFDDTIEHEAWNDSDKLRVVLIVDIWNPYLSATERELVTALLDGVRSYYGN